MKRTAADRTARQPKPVDRVEVKEGGTKKRVVLLIVAILVALGAFYYSVSTLTKVEGGWRVIEATSASEMNCAQNFVFRYYLGHGNMGAAAENKALTLLYTEATEKAYRVFSAREDFLDCKNLFTLNRSLNQPVQVDPALYAAFEQMEEMGSRYVYMGPAYQEYNSLFFCTEDWETAGFDPYQNEDQKNYLQQVAAFANDPAHIQVELMGENTVQLNVSQAYQDFAREYGIRDYLDLYILQDAFVIDYLADTLEKAGYTMGVLSSHNGYTRCLSEKALEYVNPLYAQVDPFHVTQAAQVHYPGGTNVVQFHKMRLNSQKELYYYQFENGETRTAYLDMQDGLCKATLPLLTATSRETGCARMAIRLLPFYAADALDREGLHALAGEGIYPLYCDGNSILSFDPEMTVDAVAEGYTKKQ